jgi:hypothetical protein
VEEERGPKVHRPLCVLREQTGAAKCLRRPLAASALDVATVPAPPHTRRGSEHALGRVRLGVDEPRDPKVHRPLCVLREQTGTAKCLRRPLSASALDVATVPAPPHTRRRPEHSLSRVRLGVDEPRGQKVHRPLCVLREQTGAAKFLRRPLTASVLDVATVPAPSHTRRRPEHSLGGVRLRGGKGAGPKSPPATVCAA